MQKGSWVQCRQRAWQPTWHCRASTAQPKRKTSKPSSGACKPLSPVTQPKMQPMAAGCCSLAGHGLEEGARAAGAVALGAGVRPLGEHLAVVTHCLEVGWGRVGWSVVAAEADTGCLLGGAQAQRWSCTLPSVCHRAVLAASASYRCGCACPWAHQTPRPSGQASTHLAPCPAGTPTAPCLPAPPSP